MPNELTLDQLYASEEGAPAAKPPVEKAGAKELSLSDLYKDKAPPKPPTAAEKTKSFSDRALQIGHEVAAIGDMVLAVPAMAAGALGEIALTAHMSMDKDLSHRAVSQAGADFRNHIIEKGAPTWFADAVAAFAPKGAQEPDATVVHKASQWITKQIEAGGQFVDKKTGGRINADDVGMYANLVMAGLGVKAGSGAKKAETAPEVKVEPTLDAPEKPVEAIERNFRTAKKGREFSQKQIDDMHHRWVTYTSQLTDQTAGKAAEKANADKPVLEPEISEKGLPTIEAGGDEPAFEPEGSEPVVNKKEGNVAPLNKTSAEHKLAAMGYKVDRGYEDEPGYVEHQDGTQYDWNEKTKRFEDEEGNALPKEAADVAQYIGNVVDGIEGKDGVDEPSAAGSANDRRFDQRGGIDNKLLVGMAGVGLGMAAGAYLDSDNPIVAAALGGIFLTKPIAGVLEGAGKLAKSIREGDTRIRINDITQAHDLSVQRAARTVSQVQGRIAELVPNRKRREAIHNAIDAGAVASLKGKEAEAAKIAQDFYASIEKEATDAKVLESARENYSTHLWRDADREALDKILAAKAGPSMSPNSRFNRQRSHITMAEGKAAGLKPLTEDIAEVVGIYGNSMYRSIANRKLLDRLQAAQSLDGTPLVQKASRAPGNYQSINHPNLQGLRIHPDIVPSLKFMFEAQEPGAIMAAASALNTALKRNAVSFSLFHAKALSDAMLGAVNNPLQVVKVAAQATAPKIFGTNRYLKILKEGGAGDIVDKALRDGLKVSFERAESVDADVGGGFYRGMQVLREAADKVIPFGVGRATVNGYMRVNHAFDNWMWGRLHAGMKLEVYAAKKEALMENNAKAGRPISEEEAGKIAASYTNDVFGGLHWQRLAEGAKTKWGRDLALSLNSPRGRMMTQLLMFAPDWTLSTSRAFFKALPWFNKGTGVKGLFSARTAADLYRQQLARSALYYVAIGDALNYSFTGHHIWENSNPDGSPGAWTRVDLGDGRSMQLSKHFMEPFHWMIQPGQQAMNKLGVIPKEAATQALGVEYLSSKGRMPPMKDRAQHLGKNLLPIAGNQFDEGGVQAGVAGFSGFPIYGKTKEQKDAARKEERQKRHQKLLQQYRKSHGLDQ